MTKLITLLAFACLGAGLTAPATAQAPVGEPPPKILQIAVEEVKPGHGKAHEKLETAWSRAFADAKWPVHYLALSSLTGVNAAWYLSGYPSFAAMEKADKDMEKQPALQAANSAFAEKDGEHLSGGRSIIAVLQESMSRPMAGTIGSARFFRISRVTVRAGHTLEYLEANRLLRAAYEKAGVKAGFAVFSVVGGYPVPSYLSLTRMTSMAEMDEVPANTKALREAMGEETFKTYLKLLADCVAQSETLVFAVNPLMSYPRPAWVEAEPGFWKPAPPAKAPAAKAKAEPAKH